MTIAEKILNFYESVHFTGLLPDGIGIMNPYRESSDIRSLCHQFYNKFYSDTNKRKLILGINPGRLGAGATGIPFTDTKRLNNECGIPYSGFATHEPSSVYIYEVIAAYGGPEKFYKDFYINSVCPLGFVKKDGHKTVNYNYYDSKTLQLAMDDFIFDNIQHQINLAGSSDICYCLGTGKNFKYLETLNKKHQFFNKIVPLEHPRYVMQYKTKQKDTYIAEFIEKLSW